MTLFALKWSWWRIKKYLQQKISRKVLVPQTTADFTSRVSKSYVPFTCKFPMVMHFVPILHRRCRSNPNFYVFSYDKTSLKFCASIRFFLAVFMNPLSELCEKRNRFHPHDNEVQRQKSKQTLQNVKNSKILLWPIKSFRAKRFLLVCFTCLKRCYFSDHILKKGPHPVQSNAFQFSAKRPGLCRYRFVRIIKLMIP